MTHLDRIVDLTNACMVKAKILELDLLTTNELIQFFGIILLIPHLPNVPQCDLWQEESRTKYGVAVALEKPACLAIVLRRSSGTYSKLSL